MRKYWQYLKYVLRRWMFLVRLWIIHRYERVLFKACQTVHFAIYYHGEYPGASHGRWFDGLSEACWTYVCGYGIRFSLAQGNIWWEIGRKADKVEVVESPGPGAHQQNR